MSKNFQLFPLPIFLADLFQTLIGNYFYKIKEANPIFATPDGSLNLVAVSVYLVLYVLVVNACYKVNKKAFEFAVLLFTAGHLIASITWLYVLITNPFVFLAIGISIIISYFLFYKYKTK